MTNKLIIAAVLLTVSFGACKQESEPVPEGTAVNINLSSPTEEQVYKLGDTVWIQAAVAYNTQMHGYALSIEDTSIGNVYYSSEAHVHGDNFSINSYWVVSFAGPSNLQIKLSVAANHDDEPTTVYRTIHIQ